MQTQPITETIETEPMANAETIRRVTELWAIATDPSKPLTVTRPARIALDLVERSLQCGPAIGGGWGAVAPLPEPVREARVNAAALVYLAGRRDGSAVAA